MSAAKVRVPVRSSGRGKVEVDDDETRLVYSGADYLGFEVVVYAWNGDFSETDGVMREEGQPATPVGRLSVPPQDVVFREVYGAGGSLKFARLNSSNFDSVGGENIFVFGSGAADAICVELQEGIGGTGF